MTSRCSGAQRQPRCCCPGAEFLGGEHLAPARELADAGAICALATDFNPGTSPVISLPLVIGLAVRRYGWSVLEALLACTLNAAWVLELDHELGSLEPGKRADLLILDGPIERIPYRFGHNPVAIVIAGGRACPRPARTAPGGSRDESRATARWDRADRPFRPTAPTGSPGPTTDRQARAWFEQQAEAVPG